VTLTTTSGFSIPTGDTISPSGSLPITPTSEATTANSGPTGSTAPTTPPSVPGTVTGTWETATEGIDGLESECGNLSRVVARPDQDMMVVAIAQQGLWASTDGVDKWSKLGTGGGSAIITNRATRIIFDPENPKTFWESGIYNGGGVYRTDDNGVTFRQLGDVTHVEGLSVDFSDPFRQTLLVTRHESRQMFKSTDGGQTWKEITDNLPADIGYATGPVVIDAQTFLLGTSNGAASTLLRSTDGGATWKTVYDAGVDGNPLVAQSDGAMYWLLERINGIIVSHDNGATWALIPPKTAVLPAGTSVALIELPNGNLAALGPAAVIVSADHGASWVPVGPAIPITPFGLAYSAFRKALYVWQSDCDTSIVSEPIKPDSIIRLNYDPATP
jgi:photosystem II stability/assembly factor-like uncharacterized protein